MLMVVVYLYNTMKKYTARQCSGQTYKPKGCQWCRYKTDGKICVSCHDKFKKLLCSQRWTRIRRLILAKIPFCFKCHSIPPSALSLPPEEIIKVIPSLVTIKRHNLHIDHIKPWSNFPSLFWDKTNWQVLCYRCHSKKTKSE